MSVIKIKMWSEKDKAYTIDFTESNEVNVSGSNIYEKKFDKWKSLYYDEFGEYLVVLADDLGEGLYSDIDSFTCADIDFI